MSDQSARAGDTGGTAKIIYVLYLAGLVIGITPFIGVIMAYVYRGGAPDWVRTHYRLQIRTFWIGLLLTIIGTVTTFILIGWLVLLFLLIWLIARCVIGLKAAGDGRPYPNPGTWLW